MTRFARLALAAVACALALALVACGDDDDSSSDTTEAEAPAANAADLAAIKDFLLEHTERLVADSGAVRENAEAYHQLA